MTNKSQKSERVPLREGYQPLEKKGYVPASTLGRPAPPKGGTGVTNAPTAAGNGNKPQR
jgi:hypothetical protein